MAIDRLRARLEDARAWCRGRSPWLRAMLLLWGGWVLLQHLRSDEYRSLFGGLNFGLHELGHVLFTPFGQTLHMLGGTLIQVAAPLVGISGFLRQRDYFAVSFGMLWLSTNLFDVATYMGDARAQSLYLLSPFTADPIHDWNYLLSKVGLLRLDGFLSGTVYLGAVAAGLFSVVFGAWLLWQMRLPGPTQTDREGERFEEWLSWQRDR